MFNRATLIGNIGKEPEFRNTTDGREIAVFDVATTETIKDKNTGERKDKTEWHKIVIYNANLVTIAKTHAKKGSKVFIEGKIQQRKWADAQTGIEKSKTEIVLDFNAVFKVLDGREAPTQSQARQYDGNMPEPKVLGNTEDDDIPF